MVPFSEIKRTHTCGELGADHIGTKVRLNGWVDGYRNLGGLLFLDLGAACDHPSDLVLTEGGEGGFRLNDLKLGFGAGIRFPISFFLIKLDFAKNTNLQEVSPATHVHFSLGADF